MIASRVWDSAKPGTNEKPLLTTSNASRPAAWPFWEERKEKQSTERSRQGWLGRSRWRTQAGSSWGSVPSGEKSGWKGHPYRAASGRRKHRSRWMQSISEGTWRNQASQWHLTDAEKFQSLLRNTNLLDTHLPHGLPGWELCWWRNELRYLYRGFTNAKSWSTIDGMWGQRQLGKKVGRKKATEKGRSMCLMIAVESTGGQGRGLLKGREHEGNRQLNQAGQLTISTKTWGCSGQHTPVDGAHWCCASGPVMQLAWLLRSSLEEHAGRELQRIPNLYAQKVFIILPIKHPSVCYVQ